MGGVYGKLCQRWRVLSLQLLGHARLRQDCARGYLRSRLYVGHLLGYAKTANMNPRSAHGRSTNVRYVSATEENEAYQDLANVVQEVILIEKSTRRSSDA